MFCWQHHLLILTISSWLVTTILGTDKTCTITEQTYHWNPAATHPCTIPRLSLNDFSQRFPHGLPPLYPHPIILLDGTSNQLFQNRTKRNVILNAFPDNFQVTLSSSNSFSEHRRKISLSDYLQQNEERLPPPQKSNETWYLFGETFGPEWDKLLQDYHLPSCDACLRDSVALSFGIGSRGSGVQVGGCFVVCSCFVLFWR